MATQLETRRPQSSGVMPVIFAAHGAPILLDDTDWMGELASWAKSMPGLDAKELFALGRALTPLRREGVLIFGSGFLTHNMQYAFRPGTPEWARQFDSWAAGALSRFDVEALIDFQNRAPAPRMALPTWEHYAPVLVAAGAASDEQPRVTFPITGWWMNGAFTKRSVQFG